MSRPGSLSHDLSGYLFWLTREIGAYEAYQLEMLEAWVNDKPRKERICRERAVRMLGHAQVTALGLLLALDASARGDTKHHQDLVQELRKPGGGIVWRRVTEAELESGQVLEPLNQPSKVARGALRW